MPRKFIDKKKAATFHLVHRSQRDPLVNDPESSSRVLKYVPAPNTKTISRETLEEDIDVESVRKNEGEAAEYGIYFDDTEYDYMQHLRSIGDAPDGILLEAPTSKDKGKGKPKEIVFGEQLGIPKEALASEEESRYRIEAMQNIPDSLRGFQPDMNPDLREVLEALEDDEPQQTLDESDNEDPEDIFAQLVKGGQIEETNNEEDGYESDDTIKAGERVSREDESDITGSEYLAEMAQYKAASKPEDDADSLAGGVETESMLSQTSTANKHRTSKQRRKRRQRLGGAYSEAGTDFSMTSSANYRNEGLTMLDDRFEKILEAYNSGDEEESVTSVAPPVPREFKEKRSDFNAIMDEFLSGYKVLGKKMVKKTKGASGGMAELDEIRRELGRARIS